MKKIEINFYPHTSGKEKQFWQLVEKYFPTVFLGAVILIAINIILFLSSGFSSMPFKRLQKQWNEVSPQASEIDALKNELNALREKEMVYQELLTYKVAVSHVFADVFRSLPKNIWLGEINFQSDGISVVGFVVEWKEDFSTSINKFIEGLQQEQYFSSRYKRINPKGQRIIDYFNHKVTQFEVECKN